MDFLQKIKIIKYEFKIFLLIILDIFILFCSVYLTEIIYLGYISPLAKSLILYFIFLIVYYFIFAYVLKLYKQLNRFFGLYNIQNLLILITFVSISLFLTNKLINLRYLNLNFIILQNLIFLILFAVFRIFLQRIYFKNINFLKNKINAIIFGAGVDGINFYRTSKKLNKYNIVGFVDEDKNKIGRYLDALKIYSLSEILRNSFKKDISMCFLCIPSASSFKLKEINSILKKNNIETENINLLNEKKYNLPFEINKKNKITNIYNLKNDFINKSVLVTGSAGTIGQEICIQLNSLNVKKIYCLDNNEYNISKLKKKIENLELKNFELVLLDLTNIDLLKKFFIDKKIDIVFHAAAYKHVDIVEENISFAVRNNIYSTINLLKICDSCNIKEFIFISTDKAVRPTNVMGLTKRVGEIITYLFSQKNNDRNYSVVRFGNVIGSSGSLLEILRKQVADGGPITLTDPNATRYFMTISDAVRLVIKSSTLKKNGIISVLNMGNSINIYSLIKNFLKENNLSEKNLENKAGDIIIKVIGLRKGEKLHEELFYDKKKKINDDLIFFEEISNKYLGIDLEVFQKDLELNLYSKTDDEIKIFLKNFLKFDDK